MIWSSLFSKCCEEQNFSSDCILKKQASASGTNVLAQLRSEKAHWEFGKTSIPKHWTLWTPSWTKYKSTVIHSVKAFYRKVARMRTLNSNVTQILAKVANRAFMWCALIWRWGKCWRSFYFLSKFPFFFFSYISIPKKERKRKTKRCDSWRYLFSVAAQKKSDHWLSKKICGVDHMLIWISLIQYWQRLFVALYRKKFWIFSVDCVQRDCTTSPISSWKWMVFLLFEIENTPLISTRYKKV